MRVTTHVDGPTTVEVAWERYADPTLWSSWAPQIRSVETESARIRPGVTGTVHALFGVSVPFEVTEVDEAAHHWSWTVHPPGLTMRLGHTLERRSAGWTRTGLVVDGPAPIVLAYVPVARLALHRLVAAGPT